MYNWSVDLRTLEKDPEKFTVWKLEQLINFGLNGQKLKKSELIKYFTKLNIDPEKKSYLKLLLNL